MQRDLKQAKLLNDKNKDDFSKQFKAMQTSIDELSDQIE